MPFWTLPAHATRAVNSRLGYTVPNHTNDLSDRNESWRPVKVRSCRGPTHLVSSPRISRSQGPRLQLDPADHDGPGDDDEGMHDGHIRRNTTDPALTINRTRIAKPHTPTAGPAPELVGMEPLKVRQRSVLSLHT